MVPDRAVPWMCRLARLWGAAAFLGFLLWRIVEGIPVPGEEDFWLVAAQLAAWFLGAVGYVVALEWEIQGATVLAVAASGLALVMSRFYPPRITLLVLALFFVPALLYWLIWQRYKPLWEIGVLGAILFGTIGASAFLAVRTFDYFFGPTHPVSPLDALPESEIDWAWSGGVTDQGAVVRARLGDPVGEARLAVSTDEELSDPVWVEARRTSEEDEALVSFDVDGLEPDTTYHYAVEVGGKIDLVRQGRFATFGRGPWSFSFAAASCARVGSSGSVFDTIRELEPAFFFNTGDWHYADIAENDRGRFRDFYDLTLTRPAQAALYREVPFEYTWDDHDFGPNDSDSTSASRPAAQITYREAVPHYPLAEGDGQNPIHHAFTAGRVRFIVTDTRSTRSPDGDLDNADKTMLGDDQLAWFKDELSAADERYPLIVWVNSVPWITEKEAGADNWAGFDTERREIADFIAANDVDGLLMISGDAHMVAIDDGSHSDYSTEGDARFPVFQAAALDNLGSLKGGPYSHGAFPGTGRFGLVEVEDDGRDITVSLRGLTWELDELVSYTFTVDGSEEAAAWAG